MLFAAAQPANLDNSGTGAALGMMACFLFFLGLFLLLLIASFWKIFDKAGQPGWAAIVPVYNGYILTVEVCKLEIIWFILSFIPVVNIVAGIFVALKTAEKFGKDNGFAVGLILLPFIFYPILAFGSAEYEDTRRSKKKPLYDEEEPELEDDEDDERPRRRR